MLILMFLFVVLNEGNKFRNEIMELEKDNMWCELVCWDRLIVYLG